MTEEAPFSPEQEDDLLAAEFALGLLEGEAMQTAVTRFSEDAAFAQKVHEWQERLSGMAERVTPIMPPNHVWKGICIGLGHIAAPLTKGSASSTTWKRPFIGILAGLAAVAAVVAVLWLPAAQNTDFDYHAELLSENGELQIAARLGSGVMEVTLEQGAAADGRAFELWWVEPDGSAPVSLGLVPASGKVRLNLPEGMEVAEGVRIAVSDEPEGGSPTGEATGPILAISELTEL